MVWKIVTVVLAVVLIATIVVGEWQISSERHRAISGEAQLAALIVASRVSATRDNAALKSLVAKGVGQVLGNELSPIDSNISDLQREVSCLEQDITDIEDGTTSYLLCN